MKLKDLSRRSKLLLWICLQLLAIIAAVAFGLYCKVTDRQPGLFECKLHALTGLYCPGCGSTRSLRAMLRLRPITALRANPGPVAAVALLLHTDGRLLLAAAEKKSFHVGPTEKAWLILIAVSMLLWCVLRNILLFQGIDLLEGIN